jgi:hypothetical protein
VTNPGAFGHPPPGAEGDAHLAQGGPRVVSLVADADKAIPLGSEPADRHSSQCGLFG